MPEWIRHCIHVVGHMRFWRLGSILLIAGACGRTGLGLDVGELFEPPEGAGGTPGVDARSIPDAPLPDAAAPEPPPDSAIPGCEPGEEVCNGRDDDCDGKVDEVPSIPCPAGGARYCVAGRMSQCPRRCDVCIPGSAR